MTHWRPRMTCCTCGWLGVFLDASRSRSGGSCRVGDGAIWPAARGSDFGWDSGEPAGRVETAVICRRPSCNIKQKRQGAKRPTCYFAALRWPSARVQPDCPLRRQRYIDRRGQLLLLCLLLLLSHSSFHVDSCRNFVLFCFF